MREVREPAASAETKAAVRLAALKLFLKNGCKATTLEDVAQGAVVSPSALLDLYRSKADILMEDDLGPLVIAAFRAQPLEISPVAAFRNATKSVVSQLTAVQSATMCQRAWLLEQDPELRDELMAEFGPLVDEVAELVRARVGAGATNLAVRDLAGVMVRLLLTATLWAGDGCPAELVQQTEAALAKLETSLSLSILDDEEEPAETRVLTLRDGRHLSYTEWGSPDGAPIVFMHGMPGSRFLRAAAEDLYRSLGVRVITPDRPGYGLSDAKPHYRLVDWPSDVVELADRMQIGRFGVVSLSGGGLYALACATLIPERLLSVVTTGCPAPLDRPGALAGMHLFNRAVLRLEEAEPWVLAGGARMVGGLMKAHTAWFVDQEIRGGPTVDQQVQLTPWVRQTLIEAVREAARNPHGYDDDLRNLTSPWGFELEKIWAPVHLWHGDLDSVIPLHHPRYLATVIPGARLTICPGEAHMLLWNHLPEILAIAVTPPQQRAGFDV